MRSVRLARRIHEQRASTAAALAAGLLLAIAACACGDKQPRAQAPRPPAGDADAAERAGDRRDAATDSSEDGADALLTEPDCRALVDHVVEIALRRFREQAAAQGKPIPNEAQVGEIREGLQRELGPACRRMPRRDFDCAMAAEDAAALESCTPAPGPVEN